jgi:hypothetical protein
VESSRYDPAPLRKIESHQLDDPVTHDLDRRDEPVGVRRNAGVLAEAIAKYPQNFDGQCLWIGGVQDCGD